MIGADFSIQVLDIVQTALYITDAVLNNLGRHSILIPDVTRFAQYSLAVELLLPLILIPARIALLLLYRRIFPLRWLHITVNCLLAFAVALTITWFLFSLLQCNPVQAAWDTSVKGQCVDVFVPFIVFNWGNIVLDLVMLSLPIPILWKLNMSTSRKVQVTGIFLTGGL